MSGLLFIDTARIGATLALAQLTATGWKWNCHFHHPQSAGTLDFLETSLCLLRKSNPVSSLDGIIVNNGPGSFTGIKIGLSFVYGLTAANNIPARAISILQLIGVRLAERDSIQKIRLVMKATARSGYFVDIAPDAEGKSCTILGKLNIQQSSGINWIFPAFVDDSKAYEGQIYCLGDWNEFSFATGNVIYIGEADSDSHALSAAMTAIESGWNQDSALGRPLPLYIRDPAPIEK
jgi:tRNA A37 threonylcarbamoyladenosine modification protein TsaB